VFLFYVMYTCKKNHRNPVKKNGEGYIFLIIACVDVVLCVCVCVCIMRLYICWGEGRELNWLLFTCLLLIHFNMITDDLQTA
jgi:hypothetical protein